MPTKGASSCATAASLRLIIRFSDAIQNTSSAFLADMSLSFARVVTATWSIAPLIVFPMLSHWSRSLRLSKTYMQVYMLLHGIIRGVEKKGN